MSIAPIEKQATPPQDGAQFDDVREPYIGLGSAGIRLTPEEFDAIEDYDENYRYELIDGVLIVHAIPKPQETGPNEYLGYLFNKYQIEHPQGSHLDDTLSQQHVRTTSGRRIADRLVWTGLGRMPEVSEDPATIAIELVSEGRRNWTRDYVEKLEEYRQTELKEYWIIDRFQRTLTVYRFSASGVQETVVLEAEVYRTPLLPGFELPLAEVLARADRVNRKQTK